MSLSDLNEVSNFSWGCQLSYETLSVRSVSKLELPETTISHRVILDPPRLLNRPKSPHRLGLSYYFLFWSIWIGFALETLFFISRSSRWISAIYFVIWFPKLWSSLRRSLRSISSGGLWFSGLRSQRSSSSNKAFEVSQLWSSKKK